MTKEKSKFLRHTFASIIIKLYKVIDKYYKRIKYIM